MIESLEQRLLFFSSTLSDDGILTILGSRNSDRITVARYKDHLVLDVSGDLRSKYKESRVREVRFFGFGGNDRFDGRVLKVRLVADGGEGADRLTGGAGDDVLIGGSTGKDNLRGNGGNDILIGGSARDRLNGGSGDDFLDGGANRDRINGRFGNDTLIESAGNDRLRNIDVTLPEGSRPAGVLYPVTASSTQLGFTRREDGQVVLNARLTFSDATVLPENYLARAIDRDNRFDVSIIALSDTPSASPTTFDDDILLGRTNSSLNFLRVFSVSERLATQTFTGQTQPLG